MATTLHFNITTKKVKVDQTVSQDLYGIITGPSGVAFVTKNSIGNELIDSSVQSIYFNLPLDTSNNIVFGTYTIKYGTAIIDPNNSATYTADSFTYLGADILAACFTVEHNCDYYPTGLITATDSTYYGNEAGTASSPEILSRTISLFYPDGLVNPTPAVNPAQGIQSPITTGNYTLTVDTLATGMWTAIMDVELLYTQDDSLVVEYQLKKTLNHNVACVGQLCSINKCIDGMTQAYNSDLACGVTTPRYAKQLTLMNAYFSQYQMERACGNTDKANEYLNLMNELVGGESSCNCSGSGSCSGSCGSSCSCDSCGDDNTPRWINTPGSTTQSVLEQMQNEIDTIQEEINNGLIGSTGPQGVQGPAGVPGPVGPAGLNWQRAWISGTPYVADDAVGYDGASYFCILATSGTTTPDLDTSHWALLASQGAVGPQGVQGPTGPQGPSGASAAATVGYITGGANSPLSEELIYDFNNTAPDSGANYYKLPSNPSIGKVVTVLNNSSGTFSAVVKASPMFILGNYNNSFTSSVNIRAGETSRFIYTGNNYWKVEYVASTNVSFNNFVLSASSLGVDYNIKEMVVNATISALSAATLNTTYSAQLWPIGLKVICQDIVGGGLMYIKTGASTWASTPITTVV